MTLLETIRTMETVALQQPAVHTVVENDVFRLNDIPNVKYGVFAFTQGQHNSTTDGGFTTYGFSLFYIDRLNEDHSNQVQIQSTGERTLRNILLTLADEEIEAGYYIIQPFNQRFADECAGVYCDVHLTVPNDGTCPDWVPAIPQENVVTSDALEKILTRSTVRVDRFQEFTEEQQTRARNNIGAASATDLAGLGFVSYLEPQALDAGQQAQARANIGACAAAQVERLSGPAVEIAVRGSREYVCGELVSLTILSVEPSAAVSVVRFRSGAAAAELTLPASVPVAGWRIPQPETTYDIYFREGAATIVGYE